MPASRNVLVVLLTALMMAGVTIVDRADTPTALRLMSWSTPATSDVTHHVAADCVDDQGSVEVAGVIRNDGTGWRMIDDEAHGSLNVAAVTTRTHAVSVAFSFRAEKILTFVAVPDESFARAGIVPGASVGTDQAVIRFARAGLTGRSTVSPLTLTTQRYPLSNVWIYGRFAGTCG